VKLLKREVQGSQRSAVVEVATQRRQLVGSYLPVCAASLALALFARAEGAHCALYFYTQRRKQNSKRKSMKIGTIKQQPLAKGRCFNF
jgi:hypothetical protein